MKKIIFILLIFFLDDHSFADDKMVLGLEVYNNKAMCGSCHVLQKAESKGNIGPNLDKLKPSEDRIIYAVKNGIEKVKKGIIEVFIKKEDDAIIIKVSNNGPDLCENQIIGFGLRNIYDNLNMLFEDAYSIEFENDKLKSIIILTLLI